MTDALELARDWYLVEQAEKQGSARVDELTKTAANLARRIDYGIVYPLKVRIAELERQAEKRETELIKQVDCVIDLQAQLRAAQAEINRLRELVYMAHADDCTCKICTDARMANPIICCICGQPITGIEIDHRFWLHRIGCNGGECDCDLECHDECYDGHEHEYAPLFDDEEDDEVHHE